MEIKAQRKLTIAGPMFFLRRSLKEARKCMAGFQSTALVCMPGDKLHKPAKKGEMGWSGRSHAADGASAEFGFNLEGLRDSRVELIH